MNEPSHTEPVVSTLDRAGAVLGCDPGWLAEAVAAAGLPVWARHADGNPAYRWPELVQVAREHLGVRTPSTRPTLATYRAREEAKRERQRARNRKQP